MDDPATPTFLEVARSIAAARRRAAASGTTVLDELLSADDSLADRLESEAGVVAVRDDSGLRVTASPSSDAGSPWMVVTCGDGVERLLLSDPWNEDEIKPLHRLLGRYVEPAAATSQVLERAASRRGATARPTSMERTPVASKPTSAVVDFVDRAVVAAFRSGASDVHFECDRQGVAAKLRLDGVMTGHSQLQGRQAADEVISRLKVLAQLDITERRLPQDGRFRFEADGVALDLRVSIMPSVHGEDGVLRLLDKSHLRGADRRVTLDSLGFDSRHAAQIRWLSGLPSGMLLVTGPTGSGKTTTLYAATSEIHTGREKIITIEDPVEYELGGVLQIPVNERKGLTFAKGLRSILRHDPDRILVGEIRDAETASIAVQSALTGHQVFTTVHANSLFDVIGRFRHFGIDMFGFASSLNGVVVQRLMRRVCDRCRTNRPVTEEEANWLKIHGASSPLTLLPACTGCEHCLRSGYRGRFVVSEVHVIDDELRAGILRDSDVSQLKRLAFGRGAVPLVDAAVADVFAGRTTLEELFRVVGQV